MDRAYLEGLSKPIVDLYNQLEHELLLKVSEQLKGKTHLLEMDPVKWRIQMLEQLGMLDKEALKIIKKNLGLLSSEINKLILESGLNGIKLTDEQIAKAIKKGAHVLNVPSPLSSPIIVDILKAYQRQAKNIFNLTNQTLIQMTKQTYINGLNRAALDVMSGNLTGRQAITRTIKDWANKGIPALVDKAGRKWGTEGYVRMVTMTTSNNVTNELQDNRIGQYGIELVEISSHAGDRPGCVPYAGKIFALDYGHPKYPCLYDPNVGPIGHPASLFGINCAHIKYPFIEGISKQTYFPNEPKQNKIDYANSQQQRAIERGIRKAKTQLAMFEKIGDTENVLKSKALVKARQASMRKFIKDTNRTRRYDREQIINPNKKYPDQFPKMPVPKPPKPSVPKPEAQKPTKTTPKVTPQPKQQPKPQTSTTPTQKPRVTQPTKYETAPVKNIKDVVTGDRIKFSAGGKDLTGTIQTKYTSGKMIVKDESGKLHKIDGSSVKAHIPNKVVKLNYNDFSDIDRDHKDVQGAFDANRKLDPKDRQIVHKYTTSYYTKMNGHLRKGLTGDSHLEKEIESLRKALERNTMPLSQNTKLFRAIDSDSLQYILGKDASNALIKALNNMSAEDIKKAKSLVVGGTFSDKAFISSTHIKGSFGGYKDVLLEIYVPKGYKNGMFIDNITEYPGENEYLFNAGSKFRILDVKVQNGKLLFKLTPKG